MIELITTNLPAFMVKEATDMQTLEAGKQVKVEVGEDELSAIVPQGKSWDVVLSLRIKETSV